MSSKAQLELMYHWSQVNPTGTNEIWKCKKFSLKENVWFAIMAVWSLIWKSTVRALKLSQLKSTHFAVRISTVMFAFHLTLFCRSLSTYTITPRGVQTVPFFKLKWTQIECLYYYSLLLQILIQNENTQAPAVALWYAATVQCCNFYLLTAIAVTRYNTNLY